MKRGHVMRLFFPTSSIATSRSRFHQKTSHLPYRIAESPQIHNHHLCFDPSLCASSKRHTHSLNHIRWTEQEQTADNEGESCERVAEPEASVNQLAPGGNKDGSIRDCDSVGVFENKAPSAPWYPDKWNQLLDFLPIAVHVC